MNFKTCYYCVNDEYHKKQSLEVQPTLPRDLTRITLNEVMIMANSYDSAHLRAEQSKLFKFSNLSAITKNHLHEFKNLGYINFALAKSSVRIGTLNYSTATHDALSVYFCVNACAYLFIKSFSMVALVGQPKGWLDSVGASSSNPANVTANEIGTSSGDYNNQPTETVIMTNILISILSAPKLFKFYDLSTNQVSQTIATIEQEACMMFLEVSKLLCVSHNLIDVFTDIISNGGKSNG